MDPYTDIWVNFGFEPKDPFDPKVEDNVYGDKKQRRELQEEASNGPSKSLRSKCALVPTDDSIGTRGDIC